MGGPTTHEPQMMAGSNRLGVDSTRPSSGVNRSDHGSISSVSKSMLNVLIFSGIDGNISIAIWNRSSHHQTKHYAQTTKCT